MAGVSCFVRLLALFPVFHLESRKQAFLCPNKTFQKKVYRQCCKCKTIYESDCKAVPYAYCIMENCGGLVPYEASHQERCSDKNLSGR